MAVVEERKIMVKVLVEEEVLGEELAQLEVLLVIVWVGLVSAQPFKARLKVTV